jgi:peptide/nickel transport system substrate-binding protein
MKRFGGFLNVILTMTIALMLIVGCAKPTTPAAVEPTKEEAPVVEPTQPPEATKEEIVEVPIVTPTEAPKVSSAILLVDAEPGGTMVRNFNPFITGHLEGTLISIYEPLIIYSQPKSEFIPWLATEYSYNEDATKLTFKIRQGVKWSDGEPMTVDDVVFTYNLLKNFPALDGGGVWANLDSVAKVDENTVEFTFKQAYIPGLLNLGQVSIVPEHIWKDVADPVASLNENPVGTGPFTEVTLFSPEAYQIERNPYYWQEGKPMFQGYRVTNLSDDTVFLALGKGEIDWTSSFVPDIQNIYEAKDPEHNKWARMCTGNATFVYLNTTRKPFDDVNVRKALSMALDRDLMIHTALYDYSIKADATGLTTTFNRWKDPAIVDGNAELVSLKIDKANEMLDAAGLAKGSDGFRRLPDGTPIKVYADNAGWADYAAISEIVAQNFKAVGIDAQARSFEAGAWFDKVFKGDFDIAVGWSSTGSTPYETYRGLMSEQTLKPVGESSGENWHRFASAKADELLAKLASEPDEAAQLEIAHQLEELFVNEFPAIPIYNQCDLIEYNTARFEGWPDPNDPYAAFCTYSNPQTLILMVNLKPKE